MDSQMGLLRRVQVLVNSYEDIHAATHLLVAAATLLNWWHKWELTLLVQAFGSVVEGVASKGCICTNDLGITHTCQTLPSTFWATRSTVGTVSKRKTWKSGDAVDTWRTNVNKLSPCHFLSRQVQKVWLLWILGRKICHGRWSVSIDNEAKKCSVSLR